MIQEQDYKIMRAIENAEIERTAEYYPQLDLPIRTPTRDYSGSEECGKGGSHNFVYQGYSESIGHYYRCSQCGLRS